MNHPWTGPALRELRDACGLAEVEFHPEIGSTNDRALQLLRDHDVRQPMLILAHTQNAGRGRGVHRWWSSAGALTFSLLLVPQTPAAQDPAHATLRAGIAIAKALEAELNAIPALVKLKWPNDVLIGEQKICGILVETVGHRPAVVIGCGINVNQSLDEAPEDVRARATSLYEIDGQTRDLTQVLGGVVRQLLAELHEPLPADPSLSWREAFRSRCFLTGRIVELRQGSRTHVGRCLGIDDSGKLRLQTESGIQSFVSGGIERSFLG